MLFVQALFFNGINAQTTTLLTIQQNNVTVGEVLSLIEKNGRVIFFYVDTDIDLSRKVSLNLRNQPIAKILDELFKNTQNVYKIDGRQVYITKKNTPPETGIKPESRKLTGRVTDAKTGESIIGANVWVKGESRGTITDMDGNFTLNVSGTVKQIGVSYLGYDTKDINIDSQTHFNILLSPSQFSLDEVVVVGYGTQKKETVTGSVASITTKDLLQSPQANISNALAGRMPGLLSVQRSGEPGKDASTLRIRGIGTFATDASGGTTNQDPLIMVDGIESDNYNNIDPNEIESLTILKDASATAVYGVRGANGVILITTKRGLEGKPQLSLTMNVGVSNFPFLRENMNSYEYATAYNQAEMYDSYISGNLTQMYPAEQIEAYRTNSDPVFYPSIDWYDYVLKDYSTQTQTNLNIRGGTRRVKYFASLGYFTQDGMLNTAIVNTSYDAQIAYRRYNLRSNFDIDVTNNLTLSLDISTQMGEIRGPNWSTTGLMENLSSVRPNVAPGIIDGKIVTLPSTIAGGGSWTPIMAFAKGWHQDYENNLNGSIRMNYKMDYLLKGLSLRGAVSYRNFNTEIKKFETSEITYQVQESVDGGIIYIPSGDPSQMAYSTSVSKNRRVYAEMGISYMRSFELHNVTGLLLYNQSKYYSPKLAFLIPNGYQGIVGRVTYDFASRYLAEFNLGWNGTENFDVGKRFGFFPAYSLGWVVTEEPFFPENTYLTFTKLRVSYGVVGNDKIGGDRFLYRPTSYTYSASDKPVYYFGELSDRNGYRGSSEGKLGNPDLTWEKAKKLNIGGDFKFWKDKFGLTIDYFVENRDNILWNRGTVPVIIGANMPAYNLGIMKNSGYEGEITYNDNVGEFRYFVKANYTYAHNEIVFMDEVSQQYPYRYRTGQRYGQFFGYVADGIYNTWEEVNDLNRPVYMWSTNKIQPGDIKYKDINGDGYINEDDQVPIGYSNFPEVMFGLTLGGSFRGFDFSVLFQGASNVSNLPSRRTMRGFYTQTGANKDLLKSWSQERYEQGLEIVYPRYSITTDDHNYVTSTFWLEDASYVRLKNAEIGYTFQQETLKRIGLSSVRIYLNGNNLLTWSKLKFPGQDPEFPTGTTNSEPYPVTRIFNLGLNVNF